MTDGSSDDPKNEGTTVAGAEPEKAASASADTTAEADTTDGTVDRPAEAVTGVGAGTGAETQAETAAGSKTEAGTETATHAGTETEAQTKAVPGASQTKTQAGAETAMQNPAEASAQTKAETGAEAEGGTEANAMTGSQGQAKAGAAAQTEAGTGAETRPQPESAAETKADAETGARTEAVRGATQGQAGAKAVPGTEGQPRAGTRPGSGDQAKAVPGTEAQGQAKAVPGTGDKSRAQTGAEPQAGAGAGTQGQTKAVTGASSQGRTGTEREAGAGAQGQTKAVPGAQGQPGAGAGTETGDETATQTAAEGRAPTKAAPRAEAHGQSQSQTRAGTRPGAEAHGQAGAKAVPGAEGQTRAGVRPGTGAQTKAVPGTEAQGQAQAVNKPGTGAEAETGAETGAEAGTEAGTGTETGTGVGAGTDGPGGGDSRGQGRRAPRVTAPDDEADASRTQVLRVPPAAGPKGADEADTSRTQVLRVPRTTAPEDKPEPEPEPEPAADDSRTQVLRAPGPGATAAAGKTEDKPEAPGKKAAESTPKVPSWAAAREEETDADADPDPERTSRFVALKDLDAPAPVTTRPRPQPQPHTRPQSPAQAAPPQPLPPLDLLADLTNTPPPPETPRRTVLRRVKVWTPILLLLVGACIGGQMLRPLPDPRLVAAETDHTVDGQLSIPWPAKGQGAVRVVGSGDIGTFGDQKPVPTASVAKIMTAYVILKGHPLRKTEPGPDITVDAKTVADGNSASESRITGLTVGSKFSQQDMLKMLMIPSGNNVARLLARWDAGTDSEAAFVEKMNAAARELGMKDTVYTDPSGLDAGTVSTATDQLKLAEAVMKDETFRAIVALPEAPIKGLAEKLTNNNDLLTVQGLSIRGIKTGSSTPAGGTFVWAAYKSVGDETPLIIGSLMEQRAPAPDKDALNSLALVKANSKKIIEAVRAALASTPLVRKGDVVGHVDDGLGGRTPLVAVKDLNVISVPGQQFKLSLKAGSSPLPHTAKDGTEVGVLTAGEGEGAKSVPVAVKGALAEPSFGTRLTRLG
ncbi:serine hydrolase [Streptomyces erythrochromogenes]|uniref:serine hydrolase n=1 Tax=Streptomyces erythrochromogenes TaxID=285574 RepID=UPI0038303F89